MREASNAHHADPSTRVPDTHRVATVKDLRATGVSRSTLERRCRAGRWQHLLPGVLLLSEEAPSRAELVRAALHYAGPSAVLTGVDAMAAAGMHVPAINETVPVHVLVPAERRVGNHGVVLLERTTRLPEPHHAGDLAYAPPIRATLDGARRLTGRRQLAALLTHAINSGRCPVSELRGELDAGSQRGSAIPRAVLAELERGLYAVSHRRARRIIAASGLPEPDWAVPVHDGRGHALGTVDAHWEDVGLAWDFGALATVAGETSTAGARRRDTALAALGVLVLRTPNAQLRSDPHELRRRLTAAFCRAARNRQAADAESRGEHTS